MKGLTISCLRADEDNDKRKRDIENLKQDHLHKVKNDKNHWEEGLASDSESNVRSAFSPMS